MKKHFKFLKNNKEQLELIAQKLLELETLDERTIKSLFETGEMPAPIAEDEYPSETEAASFEETKKALAKRDAEQAEGKEVPEEHEEVEVADVTEAPSESKDQQKMNNTKDRRAEAVVTALFLKKGETNGRFIIKSISVQ